MKVTAEFVPSDLRQDVIYWLGDRELQLKEAMDVRISPKVRDLVSMELEHLGFFKEFPDAEEK